MLSRVGQQSILSTHFYPSLSSIHTTLSLAQRFWSRLVKTFSPSLLASISWIFTNTFLLVDTIQPQSIWPNHLKRPCLTAFLNIPRKTLIFNHRPLLTQPKNFCSPLPRSSYPRVSDSFMTFCTLILIYIYIFTFTRYSIPKTHLYFRLTINLTALSNLCLSSNVNVNDQVSLPCIITLCTQVFLFTFIFWMSIREGANFLNFTQSFLTCNPDAFSAQLPATIVSPK